MTSKEKLTREQEAQRRMHEENLKWQQLNTDGDMVHYVDNIDVRLSDFERVFGFNFQQKVERPEPDLQLTLIKTSEPGVFIKHVVDSRDRETRGTQLETMIVYMGYRSPKLQNWEAQFSS